MLREARRRGRRGAARAAPGPRTAGSQERLL